MSEISTSFKNVVHHCQSMNNRDVLWIDAKNKKEEDYLTAFCSRINQDVVKAGLTGACALDPRWANDYPKTFIISIAHAGKVPNPVFHRL